MIQKSYSSCLEGEKRGHPGAHFTVPLGGESSQSLLGHTCLQVPKVLNELKDPPGPQPKETDLNMLATQKAGTKK